MKVVKYDNRVDMDDWMDTFFGVEFKDGRRILIVVRSVLMENGEWETGLFEIGSLIPRAWAVRKSTQKVEAESDHAVFVQAVLERLTYKDGEFIGKKKKEKKTK